MHFTTTLFSFVSVLSLVASSPVGHGKRVDVSTTTAQMYATSTTSSSTACPTTPEEGTYCGFINPEDPCAPQPGGQGPKMVPDTVDTFVNYTPFQSMSLNNTVAPGYTNVYKNLTSATNACNYLGLYYLDTYSVSACAAKCDELSNCNSFNIYVERDPSVNPTKNDSTAPTVYGYWCPNPASITNYKCALWNDGITNSTATNDGQNRGDFKVVISGSNAFVKSNFTGNSTTCLSKVTPTRGNSSQSSIVAFTGAANAVAGLSIWGGCAFVFAVLMVL